MCLDMFSCFDVCIGKPTLMNMKINCSISAESAHEQN